MDSPSALLFPCITYYPIVEFYRRLDGKPTVRALLHLGKATRWIEYQIRRHLSAYHPEKDP